MVQHIDHWLVDLFKQGEASFKAAVDIRDRDGVAAGLDTFGHAPLRKGRARQLNENQSHAVAATPSAPRVARGTSPVKGEE